MSQIAAGSAAIRGGGASPLRWWVLVLAAIAVSSSYYESDVIGPIADPVSYTHLDVYKRQ